LPLQLDSGTVSNRDAQPPLTKLGRVGGYLLDYGNPYSGGAGVTSIQTQVERYRTPVGAKKALKFWKAFDELEAANSHQIGVTVAAQFFKTPALGGGHFSYLTWMRIPNVDPIYTVDEVARSGSFVLHATVAAGTESAAERLGPALAARLVHRLHGLLDGRLHAKPAKLPPPHTQGPPTGGPDLSALVVGPSDFPGQATVIGQGYATDPFSLSDYSIYLQPAGLFDEVQQSISWYANANETTWQGTLLADAVTAGGSGGIDLGAVGDNAHAVIGTGVDQSGKSFSTALVVMWQGQAFDTAIAMSSTTIQPAAVQTLAQAMASRLNAGLGS
jgi:hypothetical protein